MDPDPTTTTLHYSPKGRFWEWTGSCNLETAREAAIKAREFLADEGIAESELSAWELLIAEITNNIVKHAASIDFSADWRTQLLVTDQEVICRVNDQTDGFQWPEEIDLPPADSESGRGLFLIHSLSDDVEYRRAPGNNELTVRRKLDASLTSTPVDPAMVAMTEELSYCYESLANIFQFTEEAGNCDTIEQFVEKVLHQMIVTTGSCCGSIHHTPDGQNGSIVVNEGEASCDCGSTQTIRLLQLEAINNGEDQWIYGDPDSQTPTGYIHPFFDGSKVLGIVTLHRPSKEGGSFNSSEVSMILTFSEFLRHELINHRSREEAVKAKVTQHEIELAAEIQESLLPTNLPELPKIAIKGSCECARTVGGDFYDIIPCPNGELLFVMADVMGKGVAASLIAAITRSTIRCMQHEYRHPARLLEKAAEQMYHDLDQLEMFVTIAVGMVDADQGIIRIANAGHCPVVIVGDKTLEAHPDDPPLGIEEAPDITEQTFEISQVTSLLVYTDGFDDPRNQHASFESQDAVTTWFSQAVSETRDPEELSERLIERLRPDTEENDLADDQTFITMTIQPPSKA